MSKWRNPTLLLTCAVALIAGCAGRQSGSVARPDLGATIAFSDPAMCRFTDDTTKLLGAFVGGDGDSLSDDWIRPGTVPPELRDRFGPITLAKHQGWWVVSTRVRGDLWGLPLVAIHQEFPEGGDPGGFSLEFAVPSAEVEQAARARGFAARAGENVAMGEPDALRYSIDLHPTDDGQGSILGCGYS